MKAEGIERKQLKAYGNFLCKNCHGESCGVCFEQEDEYACCVDIALSRAQIKQGIIRENIENCYQKGLADYFDSEDEIMINDAEMRTAAALTNYFYVKYLNIRSGYYMQLFVIIYGFVSIFISLVFNSNARTLLASFCLLILLAVAGRHYRKKAPYKKIKDFKSDDVLIRFIDSTSDIACILTAVSGMAPFIYEQRQEKSQFCDFVLLCIVLAFLFLISLFFSCKKYHIEKEERCKPSIDYSKRHYLNRVKELVELNGTYDARYWIHVGHYVE